MSELKIQTSPIFPPIPIRSLDWCAHFDNYEPGQPIGHGATEQEAIERLERAGGEMSTAFHRWLLKHRPLCELCTGPYPSTRIIDIQGHNKAVCDAHFASHHPLRAGYERKVEIFYQSKNQE